MTLLAHSENLKQTQPYGALNSVLHRLLCFQLLQQDVSTSEVKLWSLWRGKFFHCCAGGRLNLDWWSSGSVVCVVCNASDSLFSGGEEAKRREDEGYERHRADEMTGIWTEWMRVQVCEWGTSQSTTQKSFKARSWAEEKERALVRKSAQKGHFWQFEIAILNELSGYN